MDRFLLEGSRRENVLILMRLYETHLPVANTEAAKDFYTRVVGLPFAFRKTPEKEHLRSAA